MATSRCIDSMHVPCGLQFSGAYQSTLQMCSSRGRVFGQNSCLVPTGGILDLAEDGYRRTRCNISLGSENCWRSSRRQGIATESLGSILGRKREIFVTAALASDSANRREEGKEVQGLKALDTYFSKLKPKAVKAPVPEPMKKIEPSVAEIMAADLTQEEQFMKTLMERKEDYKNYRASVKEQVGQGTKSDLKFQVTSNTDVDLSNWELPEEQSSNSNIINVLVAINVAVHLFGLATPHEAHGMTDLPLPMVYGAKVNELMVAGQWWRFITPMFLHASLLHVSLSSWALLSFGPVVESAYGTIGFAMIYFLGGLFGDLASFFHTTEWTVGGTGPIYALVGTWVVYLLKNREVIGKEIADDMIRKVVILSAVNVALCDSLPIDDWTHLGAALFGIFFGILASPTMQMNVAVKDMSTPKEDDDAAAYLWFNSVTSPVWLGLIFTLSVGIFLAIYQLSIGSSPDFFLLQDTDLPF